MKYDGLYDEQIDNGIKFYKNVRIRNSLILQGCSIGDNSLIASSSLSNNVIINRQNIVCFSNIGRFTYSGRLSSFMSVDVGAFCSISWQVTLGGAKHDYKHASSYPERKFQEALGNYFGQNDRNETANTAYMGSHCVIGNDVWIASNVVILRDVRIGNGAVVGAGAVVTKDVEPYAIVVGVPARTIKYRFNDNIIQDLESIRWWDWPMELINKHRNLLFNTKLEEKEIQALLRISEGIQKSQ